MGSLPTAFGRSMEEGPQSLDRSEVLRGVRISNWDAGVYTAFLAFTGGAFTIGYARLAGLNDFWLGVLVGLPALVGIANIPGSIWGDTMASRRLFCIPFALLMRVFWVIIAILPWLPLWFPSGGVLIACLALTGLSSAIIGPAFLGWLGDLVPEGQRGWFFAYRTAVCSWVAVALGLPAGLLVDQIKAHFDDHLAFATAFGLGVIAMLASYYFFARIPEPPRATVQKRSLREAISSLGFAFTDRSMRPLYLFFLLVAFSTSFPGAFLPAYMLEELKMNYATIQILGTVSAISTILSTKMWGFLTDKFGSKAVLAVATAGVVPIMGLWIATNPEHMTATYIYLVIGNIFGGVFWAGVGIAQLKMMIEAAPEEHRSVSVGAISALVAVVMGVAPMVAGVVMNATAGHIINEYRYETLFGITLGFRLLAAGSVFFIRDRGQSTVKTLVTQLGSVTPTGVMALRSLVRKHDPESREAAVVRLGESKMEIAIDELAKVLSDPQPSVRRKAVIALGQIGGSQAAEVIVEHLRQRPEAAIEEMVDILAQLGEVSAVEALVPLLQHPSPSMRLATARALGRIGGLQAVAALIAVALPGGDPDLRRTAIRALGGTGAAEATEVVIDALDAPEASIRIVAAEATAALGIREAAQMLRDMLPKVDGAVAAEMDYALGAVGEADDLDRIMRSVERLHGGFPRQRAVLGIGKLLGVESDLYRLFVLQGMELDAAVLKTLRKPNSQGYQEVIRCYSQGDEAAALRALASLPDAPPVIRTIAGVPCRETFLLSIALLGHGTDRASSIVNKDN